MSRADAMHAAPGERLFRQYPKYEDSGVEWLGEVPAHWGVARLKRLGSLQGGAGFPDNEQGLPGEELPFFKVGDMLDSPDGKSLEVPPNSISRSTSRRLRASVLPEGTVVFPKVGAALRLNRRRILTRPSCIDNNMMGFTPTTCDLDWIFHWLSAMDLGEIANPGAVPSVNEGQVRELPVAEPPLPEQRAIAAFLDRETARIDALVVKKERLIELLQEKRKALISHAVTKGLEPNVPMRDSGVEWLGEIPTHWEVRRLKHLSSVDDEALSEETDPELEITYVDIGNVDASAGIVAKEKYSFADAPSRARKIVRHGDVIVSTVRTYLKAIAPIAEPEANLVVSTGFAVIRPRLLDSGFAAFALRAPYFVDRVVAHSVGVSYPAINPGEMVCLHMAYPPTEEQRAIAVFLGSETARIDGLAVKVLEGIERLKEYRAALISAAVTGKIDVRGAK